jgi:hypothetical protein
VGGTPIPGPGHRPHVSDRYSAILTAGSVVAGIAAILFYLAWEFAHRGLYQYATAIYPFDDADEWRYTACSRLVEHGYALFSQVFSAQPPLLFVSLAAGMRLTQDSIAGARIVEVAFGLLTLLAVLWLAWQLVGPVAAGAAAVVLALSPAFLVYSRAVEAEGPMMALMTLSLAVAVASGRRDSRALALLSGLALAASILVKLFALEALAPALWALAIPLEGPWQTRRNAIFPLRLSRGATGRIAVFLAATVIPMVANFLLISPAKQWSQVIALHSHAAALPLTRTINTLQVVGQFLALDLGLTLLAVAGILALLIARRFSSAIFLVLWVGGTIIMLLLFRPLFPHHPAILLSGLALCAGSGIGIAVQSLVANLGRPRVAALPVALAAIAYLLLGPRIVHADRHVLLPGYRQDTLSLVPYVAAHTSSRDLIAVDDLAVAGLANRLVAPPLCDPSNVRLQSGYLTAPDLIGATQQYRVRLVLPSFGIFHQVSQYEYWLAGHYRPAAAPAGRTAYFRR